MARTVTFSPDTIPKYAQQRMSLIIADIWRTEGVRGLMKGWQLAMLKSAPTSAVTWLVYGFCFDQLQQNKP